MVSSQKMMMCLKEGEFFFPQKHVLFSCIRCIFSFQMYVNSRSNHNYISPVNGNKYPTITVLCYFAVTQKLEIMHQSIGGLEMNICMHM